MRAKAIVAFLVSIVTVSQPAFTAARTELPTGQPPRVETDVQADGDETKVIAMPFSSLRLNPALVEYLGLSPTQVRSIQRFMDQQRPTTEPLMVELRTVSTELGIAIRQNQNTGDESAAHSLAATQARLLKQLMMANSRLQRRIDDVLDLKQRKKLDALKRMGDVAVGEGN
jgi:hypothetical protein